MMSASVFTPAIVGAARPGSHSGTHDPLPADATATPHTPTLPDAFGWFHLVAALVASVVLARRRAFSPSSLRGRDVTDHPWWVWGACAAMVLVAQIAGAVFAASLAGVNPAQSASPRAQAVVALGMAGSALLAAVVLVRLVGAGAPRAGLRLSPADLRPGLLAFLAAWPIVVSVGLVAIAIRGAAGLETPTIAHPTLRLLLDHPRDPWAWTLVAVAVLAVPFIEEVLYRGFVQSLVLRASGKAWVAVAASTGTFTLAHVQGSGAIPWHALIVIGVLGLALGLTLERTRRLGACVLVHTLFNGANVALALAQRPA